MLIIATTRTLIGPKVVIRCATEVAIGRIACLDPPGGALSKLYLVIDEASFIAIDIDALNESTGKNDNLYTYLRPWSGTIPKGPCIAVAARGVAAAIGCLRHLGMRHQSQRGE